MARNNGLITTHQLRDAGLTTTQIRHALRTGALVVVRRRIYCDGELWRSLAPDRGRQRLRTRAATLTMHRGFVVSHDSSALEHELEILLPPDPFVHITRPGSTNAWTQYGVKHHLARFSRDQVQTVAGMEVLDLARTAVDIAREHGEPYGEIACDAALRRGVRRRDLEDACAIMDNWPHIRRTRRAVEFARPEAANLAETLLRILVDELELGALDPQFPVQLDDGRVVWCDLRVGCHIFEFDGQLKYRAPQQGGVAEGPLQEVIWAEKKRDIALGRQRLGTSHVIWADLWPPHREEAKKRLLTEYLDTVERFGTRLPERLVRQARELRRGREA